MGSLMLGASWLAYQATRELRALCVRSLELGFDGPMPCPTEPMLPWAGLAPLRNELPLRLAAVRAHSPIPTETEPVLRLAAAGAGERSRALEDASRWARLAADLKIDTVVLEPGRVEVDGERTASDLADGRTAFTAERVRTLGERLQLRRDRHLDLVVRSLHGLLQAHPETTFALTGSFDLLSLGEPAALRCIFEDLRSRRLRYWHDCGVAYRRERVGLGTQGSWLEKLHNWLCGVTYSDATDGETLLPPGSGGVDYGLVASYTKGFRESLPGVVELHPALLSQDLRNVRSSLRRFGL